MNEAKLRLWQFLYDQGRVTIENIPAEYREHIVETQA
jgi:hypothetical protein